MPLSALPYPYDAAVAPAPAYDVAVVGAGPAGCAAATVLGRAGHRVLVLDRAPGPRPRLCTHALMPSALPVLEELGVLDEVEAAGAARWWGVRLTLEGTHLAAPLPRRGAAFAYGLSLRRPLLDPILVGAAVRSPSVDLALGWTALSPLMRDGAVHGLRLLGPSGERQSVSTRLVIAADGRRSPLLASAGCPQTTLPNRHSAWIAYVAGLPVEERPCLEAVYRGGRSLSLLPADAGLRVLGVISPGNRWTKSEAPDRMLTALHSLLEAHERTRNARIVSVPVAVRGLRNAVRLVARPGLVPVGDAALQSDPAFGQGIAWALRGGRRLARAVDTALRAPGTGPLLIPASRAREPLSLPLLLGMSAFSAIPSGSLVERLAVLSAARAPVTSTLALRVAAGFSTAAPDHGPRRTATDFLRDVLDSPPALAGRPPRPVSVPSGWSWP